MKSLLLVVAVASPLLVVATLAFYGLDFSVFEDERRTSAPRRPASDKAANSVLLVGASLISRGGWVEELERQLRACNPDASVMRLAKAGANSAWGLSSLREHFRQARPDIVVVAFAGNDASLWRGFPVFVSRSYHSKIIALSQHHGAQVILATMNPALGREAWERPGQRAYRNIYRDLADELGLSVVDATAAWLALDEETRAAWLPDHLHPTEEAMRHIAVPAFAELLQPILCPGN
ncbi:Arylesterase [Defluviimonas aquaemixtae]|uniref:Arylesterase n=1 Tax=Albidovulum aquaemixtae TaxID=1542388 RepID=A0A2R8BLH6_9RHOB|nr:GDSL-type esterase/lipase family protein [Defluviimonas aquaemixtae]SPH24272.1 Arylesterase [Defluviimonas aquaemixtae]